MSDLLAKYAKQRRKGERDSYEEGLAPGERRALEKLRDEAGEAGATLASDGEGGLPPSLVLGVMRRDGFRCKRCGLRENLSLHHKSEHMESPKAQARSRLLKAQGRVNSPANLVTACAACHDRVHGDDREEHGDEEQR